MRMLVTYVSPLAVVLLLLVGMCGHVGAQRRAPRERSGTSLLLEVKAEGADPADVIERTLAVIRRRCARLGAQCRVEPRPGGAANRLALQFSTALDAARVKNILLAEGVELRAVVSIPYPFPMTEYETRGEAEAEAKDGRVVLHLRVYDGPDTYVVAERAPIVTGDDLRSPFVVRATDDTPGGGYVIDSRLKPAGAARLKAWTRANVGSYVVVVYNGQALQALYVKAPIAYNVVVAGGFDRRQAEDVAAVVAGGNLPAPVAVLEERADEP